MICATCGSSAGPESWALAVCTEACLDAWVESTLTQDTPFRVVEAAVA